MPTYTNDMKTSTLFLFNHIIAWIVIPKSIVMDHGTHFYNAMMVELTSMLYLDREHSSPYYLQDNGQVESNLVLKTMLQRMVGKHKSNWHVQLFLVLWAYQTTTKTTMGFTPFHFIYGLEVVLPIECKIPLLRLIIELLPHTTDEEQHLLYMSHLDEIHQDAALANKTHQKRIKKDIIEQCDHIPSQKVSLSLFTTRMKTPCGQRNSNCFGTVPTLFEKY